MLNKIFANKEYTSLWTGLLLSSTAGFLRSIKGLENEITIELMIYTPYL